MKSEFEQALAAISACIGEENIFTSDRDRTYYSQDYYRKGLDALAAVKPQTLEQLSQTVKLATDAGLAVFPRGGGYSYSDGYLPTTQSGIVIDTLALNRIVEINQDDMYVTVETGCTWAALEEALSETDVRPGFWGTMSGLNSTIGGTISQGGASFGSAKFGTSSESVLAVDIVTADGSVVSTGSAGQTDKSPFFRYYGPDMTGLFCADAGALGIKATVTLRLERRQKHVFGLSFGYETFESMVSGIAAVARESRATEHLSFSAKTMANFGELSLQETIKTVFAVAKASSSWPSAINQIAKMGFAGKRFLDKANYMSHCVVEGANKKELAGQIDLIRKVVKPYGFDLPNTVPTVIRAMPFPALDVLTPEGKRGLPIQTVLPLSRVCNFHQSLNAYYAKNEAWMQELGITQQPVLGTMGTTGFLYEPVLYWDDRAEEFHSRHTNPDILAKVADAPNNIEAQAAIEKMRLDIIDIMHEHGGVHLQIGKAYPYLRDRSEGSLALISAIKKQLDPKGLMNPGALGLANPQQVS